MRIFHPFAGAALAATALAFACTDQTNPTLGALPDAGSEAGDTIGAPVDSGTTNAPDAATDIDSGLSGKCADAFGDKLTEGFGRIDGLVYAVQKPSDTQCVLPNDDHVIVQVMMDGAVYRLVTNVLSTGPDPNVRYAAVPHALPAPAFAEGWHTGVSLDYPTTLAVHNGDFTAFAMDDLVAKIAAELKIGAKVSVYGTVGQGRPDGAHLIHRNSASEDGAIVVDPTGSPKFLLFHFDEQVF